MKSLGADLPLSTWLYELRAQIGEQTAESLEFRLSVIEAAALMDLLASAAREAKLLEARAASAPPMPAIDNVLKFAPLRQAPRNPNDGVPA